jgi:hypothetical protein
MLGCICFLFDALLGCLSIKRAVAPLPQLTGGACTPAPVPRPPRRPKVVPHFPSPSRSFSLSLSLCKTAVEPAEVSPFFLLLHPHPPLPFPSPCPLRVASARPDARPRHGCLGVAQHVAPARMALGPPRCDTYVASPSGSVPQLHGRVCPNMAACAPGAAQRPGVAVCVPGTTLCPRRASCLPFATSRAPQRFNFCSGHASFRAQRTLFLCVVHFAARRYFAPPRIVYAN